MRTIGVGHWQVFPAIEEVFMGCANQAGEENRNVARMSSLLASLPTLFRHCWQRQRRQRLRSQRRRRRRHAGGESRSGEQHGLTLMARILGMATADVELRIMGYGPVPAVNRLTEWV